QAPISTNVAGAAPVSTARPARSAASNRASPSSSGMKPRVARAACTTARTRTDSSASSGGSAVLMRGSSRGGRGDGGAEALAQVGSLASGEGNVDVEPLHRLGHPAGSRSQGVIGQELNDRPGKSGITAQGGDGFGDPGVGVLGEPLENGVPGFGDAPPDGLAGHRVGQQG